jgi:hypothetical protein
MFLGKMISFAIYMASLLFFIIGIIRGTFRKLRTSFSFRIFFIFLGVFLIGFSLLSLLGKEPYILYVFLSGILILFLSVIDYIFKLTSFAFALLSAMVSSK